MPEADVTAALLVRDLHFGYGGAGDILAGASLCLPDPSIAAIVGFSGSGKTTLLRLVAGLLEHGSGRIEVCGKSPCEARERRWVGLVQQQTVLLRWRNVADNIRLAAEVARQPTAFARVADLCREVGLEEATALFPEELSEGMAARVALARSLLLAPKLLLMDEPFAHLDEINRHQLEALIRRIHIEQQVSCALVTHNLEEAVFLADRVYLLDAADRRLHEVLEVPFGARREPDIRFSESFRESMRELSSGLNAARRRPVE